MTFKKVTFLAVIFLLLSSPCQARGYLTVKMGAAAQFVYVQMVDVMNGQVNLRLDVTSQIPHTMQTIDDEQTLVIN